MLRLFPRYFSSHRPKTLDSGMTVNSQPSFSRITDAQECPEHSKYLDFFWFEILLAAIFSLFLRLTIKFFYVLVMMTSCYFSIISQGQKQMFRIACCMYTVSVIKCFLIKSFPTLSCRVFRLDMWDKGTEESLCSAQGLFPSVVNRIRS